MQHLLDVVTGLNRAAILIICLQEPKLASLTAPTGYTVIKCTQHARQGGGIAMLVPQSLHILRSTTTGYHVYVLIVAGNNVLHVINCYLQPSCPCTYSEAWAIVLHKLDSLPTMEPIILVGDFNAHLGGLQGLTDTPCPLHGEER